MSIPGAGDRLFDETNVFFFRRIPICGGGLGSTFWPGLFAVIWGPNKHTFTIVRGRPVTQNEFDGPWDPCECYFAENRVCLSTSL